MLHKLLTCIHNWNVQSWLSGNHYFVLDRGAIEPLSKDNWTLSLLSCILYKLSWTLMNLLQKHLTIYIVMEFANTKPSKINYFLRHPINATCLSQLSTLLFSDVLYWGGVCLFECEKEKMLNGRCSLICEIQKFVNSILHMADVVDTFSIHGAFVILGEREGLLGFFSALANTHIHYFVLYHSST